MKKLIVFLFLLISTGMFMACKKEQLKDNPQQLNKLVEDSTSSNSSQSLRVAPPGSGTIPFATMSLLESPVRDYEFFGMNPPSSLSYLCGTMDYHCCNDICLGTPTGTLVEASSKSACQNVCIIPGDGFGRPVAYIGSYGTDPRQKYYVYLPDNVNANSPIVIFIHGGAWMLGPDPATTNGPVITFSDDPSSATLLNDLLSSPNDFVVVSLLYRLVKYGDNNAEIDANTIGWVDQVNDIDAAILHMRANFGTCLYGHPLNANNIQLIGESAGGHLALMWAYTKANTSYIKSVISCYAPTNVTQFAAKLNNKPYTYICGTDYFYNDINGTYPTHFPYYFATDITTPNQITSSISPLTCTINTIFWGAKNILTGKPFYSTPNPTPGLRVVDLYKEAESAAKNRTNPVPIFTQYSPVNALNTSRIIPTFIMHGTDDWIAPYKYCTDGMKNKMISTGGLIDSLNSTYTGHKDVPTTYTTSNKHLLKTYTNANHGFASGTSANGADYTTIRADILKWFNGHK
ncbi:MAG TPA: alpha/beta hydrolase [Chitinophagales bacterium]|nr:alpha/beta hydrolase [Chitinophagales bacterium]